ncbi:MAG: ATP-binding protein, partial [Lachnospiraceae bacterium]|nr:ATP-binding protein [Lachnospiraceae bacterium]
MRRYFNTEGLCKPNIHYMVNLDNRLDKIKRLYIDRGKYFIINRGRQYGKTTTLRALAEYLKNDYRVISLDFQGISTEEFKNEFTFTKAFMRLFEETFRRGEYDQNEADTVANCLDESSPYTMGVMFQALSRICNAASKPIVMMIDEVDNASNNQVFIDFLSQLRMYYLDRDNRPIFYSVVLAGVYDIKNLKLKIRHDDEHQYNSPWNIAAKFSMDMSFSARQITAMLQEFENDNHTGMDTDTVAHS